MFFKELMNNCSTSQENIFERPETTALKIDINERVLASFVHYDLLFGISVQEVLE